MKVIYGLPLRFLALGYMTGALATDVDSEFSVTTPSASVSDKWLVSNFWTSTTGAIEAFFIVGIFAINAYLFYTIYEDIWGKPSAAFQNEYKRYMDGQQYLGEFWTPNSRAFDRGSSKVTWDQILGMITLAQDSYENFDYLSMDCQKKILCELAQKQRKMKDEMTSYLGDINSQEIIVDYPIPEIFDNYLKAYGAAIYQGQNSDTAFSIVYFKCGFSVKEFLVLSKRRNRVEPPKF